MGKEKAEQLKISSKEILDNIGTDTPTEQKVIKLIYGFICSGYRECVAGKSVRHNER